MRSRKDIIADIAGLRERLRTGKHTSYEAFSFRCLVFYVDMLLLMEKVKLPQHRDIDALLEVYRAIPHVVAQYELLLSDRASRDSFDAIALFGIMQCVTQVTEATVALSEVLNVDCHEIKRQEYWRFRNRHSHVKTFRTNRSPGDMIDADLHVFPLEAMRADTLRYVSVGAGGYIGRGISMSKVIDQLQRDLGKVLSDLLAAAKAHVEPS